MFFMRGDLINYLILRVAWSNMKFENNHPPFTLFFANKMAVVARVESRC